MVHSVMLPEQSAVSAIPPHVTAGSRQANHATATTESEGSGRSITSAWIAVLVWLVCLPAAFALPAVAGLDPFHLRGALVPIAVGGVCLAVLAAGARRLRADVVSSVAAGLFAGWLVFTMRVALTGTPFGISALQGDAGRLTAMATRYVTTWHSSDGIVPSVPSDYPPLFPWLVGRTAALVHMPAWKLLGPAEAVTVAASLIAGYLLWRRLLPGPVALAVAIPALLIVPWPDKSYELITLAVLAPWALAAFGQPPKGRLHWLPAGVIGGLCLTMYWGYLLFAVFGLAALVVITWRASHQRAAYTRHVVLTLLVTGLVSAWYLVPYAAWALMHGLQQQADLFQQEGIAASPLPFLAMTPLGVLELAGLAGLAWYWRRVWWAVPLTLLAASAYLYRLLLMFAFSATGHTGAMYYAPRLTEDVFAVAGILTIAQAVPAVMRRLGAASAPVHRMPALAIFVLAAWAGVSLWQQWMPGAPTTSWYPYRPAVTGTPNGTSVAFGWPLADGAYPKFGPRGQREPWFPVDPIVADVTSVLGPHAMPVTLTEQEQLFTYVAWPGFIGGDKSAAAATTEWLSRFAALKRLAAVADPAQFAREAAHTPFGPIDVFILSRTRDGWVWAPVDDSQRVVFSPAQFSSPAFTVFPGLPGGVVVAVRRPGR